MKWLKKLRIEVETALRPLLQKGHFMQQVKGKGPRLPVLQVFAIDGAPTQTRVFREWAKATRRWLFPLGETVFPWHTYKSDAAVISEREMFSARGPSASNVYLLRATKEQYRDFSETEDLLNELQAWIALHSVAKVTDQVLHEFQGHWFRRKKWLPSLHMGLYNRLTNQCLILSRLGSDYKNSARWLSPNRLADFMQVETGGRVPWRLDEVWPTTIGQYLETVERQAAMMLAGVREGIAMRNIMLMYVLQSIVLMLSMVGVALVLAGPNRIERVLSRFGW